MKRLLALLLLTTTTTAIAAPKAAPKSGALLYDAWYTITVAGKQHYGYYNDRLERKEDRLHFQNRIWKSEEGYLNEESLGAFAASSDLRPMFFNFRSAYRATETRIDGTVEGNTLSVRAVRAGKELPVIRRALPPKTIFSVFFPVWLGRQLPTMKEGANHSFSSILEDNLDLEYQAAFGLARLEKPDEFARKTGTKRVKVDFRDLPSTWYLDAEGVPVRIEMPGSRMVIERVPREKAEAFLAAPGATRSAPAPSVSPSPAGP